METPQLLFDSDTWHVLCLSHVHVPVQYKLTKRLVEPLSDPQLQGTDPAPKVEPMQHLLIFQESDQKLELVSSAFILDPWKERSICREMEGM